MLDGFTKNIILVFIGTSLTNFLNLLYQLLLAHKLIPSDFAAFNALLSIFMLIFTPLGTLQMATAKYCSEFKALNQITKIKFLLSNFFKKGLILSVITFLIFFSISNYIMQTLKISCLSCGYILAAVIALSWLSPIFLGGLQGLESFAWLMSGSVITSALKLALAIIFILSGFAIAGALGALLISSLVGLVIFYFPLKDFITFKAIKEEVNYKQILTYLFPVMISLFCFIVLVSLDMVLVKYYFNPQEAGVYALAQMVGKIFLFLPLAISTVMFPRVSGLKANNMDTTATLQRSLLYAIILCAISIFGYNLFPRFILKILTGKVMLESINLGRFFSISMSFFTLLYILITYFLSQKDLRFIKYLILFTLLQFFAIILLHQSLIQIQLILCINAILLFVIHLVLAYRKRFIPKGAVPALI